MLKRYPARPPPPLFIMDTEVTAMDEEIDRRLDAWIASGLISQEQAEAIRHHERAHETEAATSRGRIPLVTEALGYLGTALASAALIVALAQTWSDMSVPIRQATPLVCMIALFAAGWWLADSPEPAFARFGTALWFLSVAAFGWSLVVLMLDIVDTTDNVTLVAGGGVFAYAAILSTARRNAPLQVAMLAGVLMFAGDLLQRFGNGDTAPAWVGMGFVIAGTVWLSLAYTKVLIPHGLAYALGAAAALEGCWLIAQTPSTTAHAGLLAGILVAAVLVGASIWLRENVLLVFGSIGLFGFLLGTIAHFFGNTLGTPLVLLIAGVILLAVALMTMRLRRFTGHHPPAARAA